MINNRQQYKYYLEQDRIALGKKYNRPKIFGDEIWKYERLLRKTEYACNCLNYGITKMFALFYRYRLHNKSIKLGFSIPINVFKEGLSIAHYGNIVVHSNAKIGKMCRIQEGVNIGATGGNCEAPQIGNNVFIGSGAKILGNIEIANNIAIGANAVVTKSFNETGITIAGVPARKISNNGSNKFIIGLKEEKYE